MSTADSPMKDMQKDSPGAIAAAVVLGVVGAFGVVPQPLLVGALQDHLAFSSQQASLIPATEVFAGALTSILAAFWIRRVNWRTASFVALTIVVAGNVLSSYQSSFSGLLALRLLVGLLGQGTAFVIAISVLSTTRKTDRNFAYSVAAQVGFAAVALGALPYAIAQWRVGGIFLPLGGLALLALPMLRWVPTGAQPGHETGAVDRPAGLGLSLAAIGAMTIWCIGVGGIFAFEERIGVAAGLERAAVGGALAIGVGLGFLGAMTASVVADRWGRIPPVSVGLVAQVVAVWLLQGEMGWVRFVVIASAFHFFWNFTGPYLMGTVAKADLTGRISALIPAAQTGGIAIGTAVAGSLMTGAELQPANYVAVTGFVVALMVFLPIALRLNRQSA